MCILRNTSSHVLYLQGLVSISRFYIHVKGESVFLQLNAKKLLILYLPHDWI